MNKEHLKIVLVGKPNVGKSTLFNTLLNRREAIVGEESGLTRDYQAIKYTISDKNYLLMDTAGLKVDKDELETLTNRNTLQNIIKSDLIFFLVDGSKSLSIEDYNCANFLRRLKKKVVILVNKIELKEAIHFKDLAYELGFANVFFITGKSKASRTTIEHIVKNFFKNKSNKRKNIVSSSRNNRKSNITFAISGKPNTGKSTIFNNIYGTKRVVVSSDAGTTRDSVKEEIEYKNNFFDVVDTAGIKKKGKANKKELDRSSNYFSRKEIRYANIVLLVIDSSMPLTNLELSIASYIINEGRAVLLVFNKWDLVKEKIKVKKDILSKINTYFFDVKDVPSIFISAINKSCKSKILDQVESIYHRWNKRVKTSDLNSWLRKEFSEYNLKNSKSFIKTKFRYISQTKNRPPTFSLFCNTKKKINSAKLRAFKNKLRKEFAFEGVPIRLYLKVSNNPYKKT